jgi:hypothetical protein
MATEHANEAGTVTTSYLLLMRHGAGINAGQDPETIPPGPDHVLTAKDSGTLWR